MLDPATILQKAKTSAFYLWVLNWALARMIPFNKPHRFKVVEVGDNHLRTIIPYRKSNFNHIRGLHACGLATISEFTTGFMLISKLDMKRYRIIMQRLEMEYHYQGKMDAFAEYRLEDDWMEKEIYEPLKTQDAVVLPFEIKIFDADKNHLTTGKIFWQIKEWGKVKTKVA
jgi:hypothetical protein